MNTQIEDERMKLARKRYEMAAYTFTGNAITYGFLLLGASVVVTEPRDFTTLIAAGIGCGLGKLIAQVPYIYSNRNTSLVKVSQLEEEAQQLNMEES